MVFVEQARFYYKFPHLFSKILIGALSSISYTLFKGTTEDSHTIRRVKCNKGDCHPFLKSRLGTKKHLFRNSFFSVASPLNKKGFGLLELLVASVIGSVLISGSARFLQITLQAHNISQSLLIEGNLRKKVKSGLETDCTKASGDASKILKTDTNIGLDSDLKGSFTGTLPGDITTGDFKSLNQIEIVKIELKNTDATSEVNSARAFVVYYKKKNLGTDLNAPNSATCTTSPVNTAGCYKYTCKVNIGGTETEKYCTGYESCDTDEVSVKDMLCKTDELMRGIKDGKPVCESNCSNTGRIKVKTTENGKDKYNCECPENEKKFSQWKYTCAECSGGTWEKRTADETLTDGRKVKTGENYCDCPTGQSALFNEENKTFICCAGVLIAGRCCPTARIVGNNESCCPADHVPPSYTEHHYFFENERQTKTGGIYPRAPENKCCHEDRQYMRRTYKYFQGFGSWEQYHANRQHQTRIWSCCDENGINSSENTCWRRNSNPPRGSDPVDFEWSATD